MGVGLNFLARVQPARFLAAAAFFLPIKPAPVNVFLLLAVVFTLATKEYRSNVVRMFCRSELIPVWLLLGFLALTFFYSSNSATNYAEFITKYGRFLLIPLLASALLSPASRELVGKGFLAGMAVVLAMSYAIWLGVDPALLGTKATDMYAIPSNPTVFKSHITHNFLLVIAIYFWLVASFQAAKPATQFLYAALALLGLVNLFGMIDGRTGWLVFMVIPLYFGYKKFGFVGVLLAGLGFTALLVAAFFLVDNVNERFSSSWLEIQQVLKSNPQQGTSIGERVMYLTAGWSAFLQAPMLGYGLGGIENAVQPFTSAAAWPVFYNPHNQFLMLMLQGGLLALALYAWFYAAVVYQSTRQAWTHTHVLPLLLMYFVGNLLNSFHFDFAESVGFVLVGAVYFGSSK